MTKVAHIYVDDVTTIENNLQVRVIIDATLVAIFRIDEACMEVGLCSPDHKNDNSQMLDLHVYT